HARGGRAAESAPADQAAASRGLGRIPGLPLLPARSLHGPRPLPPVSAGAAVRALRRHRPVRALPGPPELAARRPAAGRVRGAAVVRRTPAAPGSRALGRAHGLTPGTS